MAEYIERDSLMEKLEGLCIIINGLRVGKNSIAEFSIRYKNSIMQAINDFPAADVAPVVHGRWGETYLIGFDDIKGRNCSECGYTIGEMPLKYCPNCGAKMDGE